MGGAFKLAALLIFISSFIQQTTTIATTVVALMASNAKHTGIKVYPYCDDIFSPSIPCDEKYPNGTYIDGNRPDPLSPCSNIFFMCVDGTSYCFNCQNEPPIELYYDFLSNQCLYPEQIAACKGCVNGVCPTSQSPTTSTVSSTQEVPNSTTSPATSTTVSTTQEVPDSTTTLMTTEATTQDPNPTDPTCLSFEEHLKQL